MLKNIPNLKLYNENLFEVNDLTLAEKIQLVEKLSKNNLAKHLLELKIAENSYRIVGQLNEASASVIQHKELNPKLWTSEKKLIPEVRNKIIQIVKHFDKMIEEDGIELKVDDIWIIGSNANYNYTPESDLDIHIIADESFDCNLAHLQKIYDAYKRIFNTKYDISIRGVNAEVYVENKDKLSSASSGIYSIKKDDWIKDPTTFIPPEIDEAKLSQEINKWESKYEEVSSNPSIKKIDAYLDAIYNLRTNSILKNGEFGLGNLVFKEMRRCGYLDNLRNTKTELETEELSLKEKAENN